MEFVRFCFFRELILFWHKITFDENSGLEFFSNCPHPEGTTFLKPGFPIHLLSNLKLFLVRWTLDWMHARTGMWSETHSCKKFTTEWVNKTWHFSFATVISSLHLTFTDSLFSNHDNEFFLYGKSSIPQFSNIVKKGEKSSLNDAFLPFSHGFQWSHWNLRSWTTLHFGWYLCVKIVLKLGFDV